MPLLPVPIAVNRADDLLPAARVLVDTISDAFIADPQVGVSCAAACTACCHHPVPVTPAETRSIVAAIGRLPARRRQDVEQRIAEAVSRLADVGFSAADFTEAGADRAARNRVALRYFGLDVACPLLYDGTCSIRDDRPLVCREYLVTSEPRHCADLGRGGEQFVRIRSRADVIAGFAEVSEHFGEPRHQILAFALAAAPPAPPPCDPASGPRLAALLTPTRG